ncbi:MAG: hypothetical protein LC105_00320 [Chitinophagales bacterium]|nr:hypothetical protein [Chitinophagales bacterium]MCZ2392289.1 hypothetical protein [Chitinophagales bacterium]
MRIFYIYVVIVLLLGANSCTSALKSFDRKDYDSSVAIIIDKIAKNKKVKDDDVRLLEEAYLRAVEKDKTKIQQLKASNYQGQNWIEIFNLYSAMMKRQDAILRISPIYLSDGRSFTPETYPLHPAREEAREGAAEYHYQIAIELMKSGLRSDAREAYNHLDCIFFYYKDYKDAKDLLVKAKDQGTAYVLMSVDKNPQLFLPKDFEYELFNYNYGSALNNNWVKVHTSAMNGVSYSFAVRLILSESYISPEKIKESSYVDEREIEDGWKYIYDSRGNVMKDSLGNDIKVPKIVKISARIVEVQMNRSAMVRGSIDFYDFNKKRNIKQEVAQGEAVFNHYYATYSGNKNALTEESKKKITNGPAPFPSDADMILLATNELKKQFRNIFSANSKLFNYD